MKHLTLAFSLLLLSLAAPLAHAAGDEAEEPDSNVVAERIIDAPPDLVYNVLADTRYMAELAPDDCLRKWDVSPDGSGFEVVYLIEAFRRKLDARVVQADVGTRLEWDHQGNKGFVTRFMLAEVAGEAEDAPLQTHITMTTFVNAPGWPLRKYYHNTVKPAWAQCYSEYLAAIDEAARK